MPEKMLSIIVPMGHKYQVNTELPELGDEFKHLTPALSCDVPVEIIIVDRYWPERWDFVRKAFEGEPGEFWRVHYIPPMPTELLNRNYHTLALSLNSGAIASKGELLLWVDDFFYMDADSLRAVWQYYTEDDILLYPVYKRFFMPQDDGLSEFGGHNPGIRLCKRDHFVELNGFDENYDGAYGEEDTDFETRLDFLFARHGIKRYRKKGVVLRKTEHDHRHPPVDVIPPWKFDRREDVHYLRCNQLYFKFIAYPRALKGELEANRVLTDGDIELLKSNVCSPNCTRCNASIRDREHQMSSYKKYLPHQKVGIWVRDCDVSERVEGCCNPWTEEEFMWCLEVNNDGRR